MTDLNSLETSIVSSKKSTFFYILIRSWNAFEYFDRCVNSVLTQNYKHYRILFVDDCSDYNAQQKKHIRQKLKSHTVIFNHQRKFSIRNAYEVLSKYAHAKESVVVSLDGDDWLKDQQTLEYLNKIYLKTNCYFTYGNCVIWDGQKYKPASNFDPLANLSYPKSVVKSTSFRIDPFRPLHLRTWKMWLFHKIRKTDFMNESHVWLRFCEDMAIFFPFLEMASNKCVVIKKSLSVYNCSTQNNDIKANTKEALKEEICIRKKSLYDTI